MSGGSQDLSSYATTSYVNTVSGNLQTQITSNDSDITTLQTATGVLRTDINSNDTDITTLQTATGNLDTRVTQNASNVTIVSGIAQGAADDVVTVSGLIPNFTAGSGLVLDGEEFNVYGGTGNFDEIEFLTTPIIKSLSNSSSFMFSKSSGLEVILIEVSSFTSISSAPASMANSITRSSFCPL